MKRVSAAMSSHTPEFLPAVTAPTTDEQLSAALAKLSEAIGADRVLSTPDEIAEFRDPFQPAEWDAFLPAAVVQPGTTEHVQDIVRIAALHGVHLWAQGQGRNNGYGGAAPRVSRSITVNFRRMNEVITIDEQLGYALVEPGVSFQQLYDEIEARGARLMVSVPDLGWGSLAGNSLEHGLTYLPYGKDFQAVCGMEVVTADGSVLRTNMGAMEGNESWNLYRRSLGPSLDQLFMQSNFGIVTKIGIWLMPTPEAITHMDVDVFRDEQLAPLVDILRRLRLDGTIEGVPCILNTLLIASTIAPRSTWYDGDPTVPIPDEAIDEIAARLDVGRWRLRLALYGDLPVLAHRQAKIEKAFAEIPGARVRSRTTPGDDVAGLPNPSDRVLAGVPNLDWKDMGGWYGGEHGGHMSFAPVAPLVGEKIAALQTWMRERFAAHGLDFTVDIIVVNDRSAASAAGINFDYEDLEAAQVAYETMQHLVREGGTRGYGEYRAHLHFMDLAQEQYGFGDHAYRRFVEKIKDAVDPQGIFSPGKQGIWPRALRE